MASPWIDSGVGKRCLDLALAAPALVLLSPVAAGVALAVRWRLGSPVLYRQERSGRDGGALLVSKFRSMTEERDEFGRLLPDEDRLTPFGTKLRSMSLDELPQLLAVVKGEMSLVGPRPLPVAYFDRYSEEQRRRLQALPGVTGWAQVNGRNATSWPERLAQDVWYVDHATLRLDLVILMRTLGAALSRSGVAAEGHVTMTEFLGEGSDQSHQRPS